MNCNLVRKIILALIFFQTILFSQGNINNINYLNEEPPGLEAKIFAKGIISTEDYEHGSPAFSPDFSEIYWGVYENHVHGNAVIKYIKRTGDSWSEPAIPSFSGYGLGDLYPTFSHDGKEIYFTTDRLSPAIQDTLNRFIWKIKRTEKGWSDPETVWFDSLDIYGISIAVSGNLYFMAQHYKERGSRTYNLYYAQFDNGKYSKSARLEQPISTEYYEDCPFISPDEKFMIFESMRPGGFGKTDLYISKRKNNGQWAEPVNLGKLVNTSESERFSYISPDGKYFFFASKRTGSYEVYWIDASFIYDLLE